MFFHITLISLVLHAVPQESTLPREELFQKGLAAYQNKQYAEAHDDFQKLLTQGAQTASVLHNFALSAYQLDQKPLALALWRKALSIQPGFPPARAGRDFLEGKMQMRPLERDSFSLWWHRLLESVSFFELLWLNALVIGVSGWLWIRYLADRRVALEEEKPLPMFPTIPVLLGFFLVTSLSLVTAKSLQVFTARATVVGGKVSARSLPADDAVGLFDLSGGCEVFLRRKQEGWAQVQNYDGSSGWVKDSEIFITSER